jgi:hypothetical protein
MTNDVTPAVRPVVWDRVLTIVLLVVAFLSLLVSALADLFLVAFTDYCPDPCHIDVGVPVVFLVWIVSAVVVIAGTVFSIVRLRRRSRAWWVALATLAIVTGGGVAAFLLYTSIVGY